LGDEAPERDAEQVRPLDLRRVENPDDVGGHLRNGVRTLRLVALADTAVVDEDHPEVLGEQLGEATEAMAVVPKPLHERQRLALAKDLVGDPDALRIGLHAASTSGRIAASMRRRPVIRPRTT